MEHFDYEGKVWPKKLPFGTVLLVILRAIKGPTATNLSFGKHPFSHSGCCWLMICSLIVHVCIVPVGTPSVSISVLRGDAVYLLQHWNSSVMSTVAVPRS